MDRDSGGGRPGEAALHEVLQLAVRAPSVHNSQPWRWRIEHLQVVTEPTLRWKQWLRVGEVTSAVLLAAARDGLASSPYSQPLEVAGTRAFVRSRVSRVGCPQILLRIGWPPPGNPPPLRPRRALAEVVEPLGSAVLADPVCLEHRSTGG